jgi:uncharacterized protein (TIGR02996 family)
MRTFVLRDGKTEKFWHIALRGDRYTVASGKVGARGQARTTSFADAKKAQVAHDKRVASKVRAGYVETTATGAAPSADQKALEAALVAHPDEVAAHSAYADYLAEAGDPRGEFIQVQLALEDEKRPAAERAKLRKREKELQARHERTWLGSLGRFLCGKWSGPDKPYHFAFARGWLDYVRVLPFPTALVAALARAPEMRLVRRLEVVYDMRYHPFNFYEFTRPLEAVLDPGERDGPNSGGLATLSRLLESPHLTNLRAFKLGFSDDHERGPAHSTMIPIDVGPAKQVLELLSKCPRLEELYLNAGVQNVRALFASPALANLRVLQYYYAAHYASSDPDNPYPLRALARNKVLANLTTLRLHPGREATIELDDFDALVRSKNLPALRHLQVHATIFGDDGADRIVASGILKRLKTLDIAYGNMTDAGARVLAASPDLKNLDALDVSKNALTRVGVKALRAAHPHVVTDDQHEPDDEGYLYEVDWE